MNSSELADVGPKRVNSMRWHPRTTRQFIDFLAEINGMRADPRLVTHTDISQLCQLVETDSIMSFEQIELLDRFVISELEPFTARTKGYYEALFIGRRTRWSIDSEGRFGYRQASSPFDALAYNEASIAATTRALISNNGRLVALGSVQDKLILKFARNGFRYHAPVISIS